MASDNPTVSSTEQAQAFRFKESQQSDADDGDRHSSSRKRRHHHHTSRHRSKKSKTSHLADDPDTQSQFYRRLDSDRAFQESLFDAMGDDEGANFWESVYGQPIHTYPRTHVDEETGELEEMDNEEYARHVRRKMWEKSREGIEAAREERRRVEQQQKQKYRGKSTNGTPDPSDGAAHNNFTFDFEIEASLRRGQRRKEQKRWQQIWTDYIRRWEDMQELTKNDSARKADNLFLRNQISWPVESGKRKDTDVEAVQNFFQKVAESNKMADQTKEAALIALLKTERVRWHPDKVQQRYGFMTIDESTMQGVTATFQAIDKLWNEVRKK